MSSSSLASAHETSPAITCLWHVQGPKRFGLVQCTVQIICMYTHVAHTNNTSTENKLFHRYYIIYDYSMTTFALTLSAPLLWVCLSS